MASVTPVPGSCPAAESELSCLPLLAAPRQLRAGSSGGKGLELSHFLRAKNIVAKCPGQSGQV